MRSPMITVITPTYNLEKYLAETIEAVLAQTETDFEYLIVDDGSTDRTVEIARSYADRDSRIRVVPVPHGGSSAARNAGLRLARSELIAFCDGDDRWLPTFLATSVAVLADAPPEVGATFCAFSYIDQHGRLWGKTSVAAPGDYDADRVLAGHCPQGNGSCLVLRKSCFDEAGLFDEDLRNCVDLDMWLKIGTRSSSPLFRFISEPLVEWRVRPGAISSNEAARVDGLNLMFERYGQVLTRASRSVAYIWPATLAFYSGRDELGRAWTVEARRADPWFFLRGKHGLVLGIFSVVGPRVGRVLRAAARRLVSSSREVRMRLNHSPSTPARTLESSVH
jgi:glycosyltransferase involved in cell wall biosynthesis